MGGAIIAVSLLIKLVFTPFQIKAQMTGLKMKLINPEMKEFQSRMQKSMQK
jgi:membrane protein insertase Oxa1/YidC/SpoIIIJ